VTRFFEYPRNTDHETPWSASVPTYSNFWLCCSFI